MNGLQPAVAVRLGAPAIVGEVVAEQGRDVVTHRVRKAVGVQGQESIVFRHDTAQPQRKGATYAERLVGGAAHGSH